MFSTFTLQTISLKVANEMTVDFIRDCNEELLLLTLCFVHRSPYIQEGLLYWT